MFYFRKEGLVILDNGDISINLQDPTGTPIEATFGMAPDKNRMTIDAIDQDTRNQVAISYDIELDMEALTALGEFLSAHVFRCAKEQYPEFVGLIPIDPVTGEDIVIEE